MPTLDEKIARYREFWDLKPVKRPLVGFDVGGWFPFERYADLRGVPEKGFIEPDTLDARRCLPDYRAFMERANAVEDDFIKGVCPISAIPWMEGILGCRLQRSGQTVWAQERKADWEDIADISAAPEAPWLKKYVEFVRVLTEEAAGRYPVGVPILRGVTDMMGALRGHTETIIDFLENPEETRALAARAAEALIAVTRAHHAATTTFRGGYFIEQYCMWAPGPIVRLQEDASAVISPTIYRDFIRQNDRRIAASFPYSLIHLHSSSLFLLEDFLEIAEIGVFQINRDVGEMGMPELMPYLKRIQAAGRRIFLRGPIPAEDLALVERELSPTGLMVQAVVGGPEEARELAAAAERVFGR